VRSGLSSLLVEPQLTYSFACARSDIDTTFLILAADLRSHDAQSCANLLPSSNTSSRAPTKSISSSAADSPSSRSYTPPSPEFGYPSPASSQTSPMSTYTPALTDMAVCSGLAAPASPPLRPPPSAASTRSDARSSTAASKKRSYSIDEAPESVVLPPTPAEPPAKRLARGPPEDEGPSCSAPTAAEKSAFIPYARARHAVAAEVPELPPPLPEPPVECAAADEHEWEPREAVPNLIGTLHTNAHKLKGVEGETGVYFVLPDLSVRTEGAFRIRVRLLSIGTCVPLVLSPSLTCRSFSQRVLTMPSCSARTRSESLSPVVADAHSDEFRVFSAKKFEGMLGASLSLPPLPRPCTRAHADALDAPGTDPTPLSQCFAKQGVRIPTRKVAKARASKASAAAGAAHVETARKVGGGASRAV